MKKRHQKKWLKHIAQLIGQAIGNIEWPDKGLRFNDYKVTLDK